MTSKGPFQSKLFYDSKEFRVFRGIFTDFVSCLVKVRNRNKSSCSRYLDQETPLSKLWGSPVEICASGEAGKSCC